MMEIINVQCKGKESGYCKSQGRCAGGGGLSDDKKPAGIAAQIDKKLGGAIAKVMKLGDFKAKANTTTVIYTNGAIAADEGVAGGLGERKKVEA